MEPRWDVFGFGAVAVDDLIYVDHHPQPDAKMPIRELRRDGGGLTGTALVAAARMGAKAAYGGVLGDDELSRFSIQALEREGIDCTPMIRRPDARPIHAIVIVDRSTARRSILYSTEGVTHRPPETITEDLIARCRVLFVDSTTVESSVHAARIARRLGIPVVGDIESVATPGAYALIDQVDHLIIGHALAQQVTGESDPVAMVRALARPDRACCVVTMGEHGCWYAERDGDIHHVPAFPVRAVDTTGCGDVFHGAYAACIARGEDTSRAIQVATAAAALKATHPGGRRGIPTRAAVEQFLQARARAG